VRGSQLCGCVLAYLRNYIVVVFRCGAAYRRAMGIFRSATTSREGESHAVRDGNSAVSRLVLFMARMLLWGCVLLLIIRGIFSEFSTGPQTATTTRGVPGPGSVPSPARLSTSGSMGAVPAYPARPTEGK
jgi:hypothetical protein